MKTVQFLYSPSSMKPMHMNRIVRRVASLLVMPAALFLAGCSGDVDVSGTGPSDGDGDLMALWVVSSGSPDYVYKFGEGSIGGGSFELGLDGDPPEEALNSYGVGVAVVVSLPEGVAMPADGQLTDDQTDAILDADPLISDRHAIIFKQVNAQEGLEWWGDDFASGMSCGECVAAPEGETFDSFKPVSCEELELRKDSEGDFCNWT